METKNLEKVMMRVEKFTNAGTLVGNAVMLGNLATIYTCENMTYATIFADSCMEMLETRKQLLKFTANAIEQKLQRNFRQDGTKFYTWNVYF